MNAPSEPSSAKIASIGSAPRKGRRSHSGTRSTSGGDWETGLAYTGEGKLARVPGNVELFLRHDPAWDGVFGFNEMLQTVVWLKSPPELPGFEPPPLGPVREEDFVYVQQSLHLTRGGVFQREAIEVGITRAARAKSFHPVRLYLDALPKWDNIKRLDRLLIDRAGADESSYTCAVTAKTLIGAIARVRRPGAKMDNVLIIEGPQGLKKSTFLRVLAGDDWFDDHLPDLRDKDALVHLAGKWIIEVAELDALRAAENSRVKNFLTRQVDNYRPPYSRREVCIPRSCIFVGTTNGSEYLVDATGGRRFWPVTIRTQIDTERIRAERDQLWAEADARFNSGEPWHLEEALERAAAEEQEHRYVADPWEGVLRQELLGREEVSVEECLRFLGLEARNQKQFDGQRLAKVLRRLHFIKKRMRIGGSRPWVYVREEPPK
jgi:predicted P-loop ATPase